MRVGRMQVVVCTALAALVLGCGDDGGDESPTATAMVTATATETGMATSTATAATSDEALRREVEEAYLAYWDAYAAAVLELDVSLVEDYATGDELEGIRQEIEDYRSDGVAARIRVEHDFEIASITDDTAVVIDEYVNNSFYVDADTKLPEDAPGSGEVIRDTISMEKVNGRWFVVRGTRERSE